MEHVICLVSLFQENDLEKWIRSFLSFYFPLKITSNSFKCFRTDIFFEAIQSKRHECGFNNNKNDKLNCLSFKSIEINEIEIDFNHV